MRSCVESSARPGVGELIALERRVHERGGDIPDGDDGEDDSREGHGRTSSTCLPSSGRAIARPEGRASFQDALSRVHLLPAGEGARPSLLLARRWREAPDEGTREATHHRNGRRAGPGARGARSRGTPASRECRAAVARQVAFDDVVDAARARRHHHDLGREEHRLGDRVGDEDHGLVGLAQSCSNCSLR